MKKNLMKRILSITLATVMSLSLCVPAFAEYRSMDMNKLSAASTSQIGAKTPTELSQTLDWKSWGLKAIWWIAKAVNNQLYSRPGENVVTYNSVASSPGTVAFNQSGNGPSAYIDITAVSDNRVWKGNERVPDMGITVSANCSFLTGLTEVIAVSLRAPDGRKVINQTLGMNGLSVYTIDAVTKMGQYEATFTTTKRQEWTPRISLYDFAASSNGGGNGNMPKSIHNSLTVMDLDRGKIYCIPTDKRSVAYKSVDPSALPENRPFTAITVDALYEQFWDAGLQDYVMQMMDYSIGDSIYVSDTITALSYNPELDQTVFEFETRRGSALWPFGGDMTKHYMPGDTVNFTFRVVEEFSSAECTFESLDYFQAAQARLLFPDEPLRMEDYVV